MHYRTLFVLVLSWLAAAPGLAYAQAKHPHDAATSGESIKLSGELRQLLRLEMAAVQEGVQALIPAIAAGNWTLVAEIANKLHDSYIMQAKLSDQQRDELHESLPAAFQEMDHTFHHSAKLLAGAAEDGNAEVVTFYLQRLTESCVSCHSRFAVERFPGFAKGRQHEVHHH